MINLHLEFDDGVVLKKSISHVSGYSAHLDEIADANMQSYGDSDPLACMAEIRGGAEFIGVFFLDELDEVICRDIALAHKILTSMRTVGISDAVTRRCFGLFLESIRSEFLKNENAKIEMDDDMFIRLYNACDFETLIAFGGYLPRRSIAMYGIKAQFITDDILKRVAEVYDVTALDIADNPHVTTVVPLGDKLLHLNASGICGIGDSGLCCATRIERLVASNNPKITKVDSFEQTLSTLGADGTSGINDAGLIGARMLREISVSGNLKITSLEPFAESLKMLLAEGECGLTNESLLCAKKLTDVNVSNNPTITSLRSSAATLCKLEARGNSGISSQSLEGMQKITSLFADDNPRITTVKSIANTLEILTASGLCGIDDDGIQEAHKVIHLNVACNIKITSRSLPTSSLGGLIVSGYCGFNFIELIRKINPELPFVHPMDNGSTSGVYGFSFLGTNGLRREIVIVSDDNVDFWQDLSASTIIRLQHDGRIKPKRSARDADRYPGCGLK